MSEPLRIFIWASVWAVFVWVVSYEILALMLREKRWPTWSRWIWVLQIKYPKFRWIVLVVTILLGYGVTTWAAIHFFFGECAFDLC